MADGDIYDGVYGRDTPRDGPHGWVQWKGTNVCMDIHCSCGHRGHIDAEFFYGYRCPDCGTEFAVGQVVRLIPVTREEARGLGLDFLTDEGPSDGGD